MVPISNVDRIIPVEKILPLIDLSHARPPRRNNAYFEYDGVRVNATNTTRKLLKLGAQCALCGIKMHSFGLTPTDKKHYALSIYAKHPDGDLVLLTIDHIIPRAAGGSNSTLNLQCACCRCNNAKADELPCRSQRIFELGNIIRNISDKKLKDTLIQNRREYGVASYFASDLEDMDIDPDKIPSKLVPWYITHSDTIVNV